MRRINIWLELFARYWEKYQIENLMTLFTNEIEYWETPFKNIKNKVLLEKEWQIIKDYKDIKLEYEIFSKSWEKYTIVWELKYKDVDWEQKRFRGTYLIWLNLEWKCDYFLQCSEEYIIN